jgi:anthranilate synthase/aminodeoxychorismate synthase-like glutamine amidotransferase
MILVVDNYDSFTYNLVQIIGEQNGNVLVLRNDDERLLSDLDTTPEKIVISPGPGRPENAGFTNEVISKYYESTPILGVCLGHQCIAHVFGAKITNADNLLHGKTSRIYHDSSTIYRSISNPMEATRYHSLIVDEDMMPDCLEVSSYTIEGEIMGIRHIEHPLEGVQFHPESVLTEEGKTVIMNFLEDQP